MIYDHRTKTKKLHAPDKRFLSGAASMTEGLAMFDREPLVEDGLTVEDLAMGLRLLCDRYGIPLDEHLTKSVKADVAAGAVPGPPKTKDAPY